MATITSRDAAGVWFHLILRARHAMALVQDDKDWEALASVARRMLFWCGGTIHGCRCEAGEMRFALQLSHASIGAVAQHLSGGYAIHLRRRRGVVGGVFTRYSAFTFDAEVYLDDFVMWLHRPPDQRSSDAGASCWTGEFAYLAPRSSDWITTERVFQTLTQTGSGVLAYERRKRRPIDPAILALFTRPRSLDTADAPAPDRSPNDTSPGRPSIDQIIHAVAHFCQVSYADMRSDSRRRTITKAKTIAAVLCTRNGASVASVARVFRRSRSTLVEQAEHYRLKQPHIFDDAERTLSASLEPERIAAPLRVPLVPIAPIPKIKDDKET